MGSILHLLFLLFAPNSKSFLTQCPKNVTNPQKPSFGPLSEKNPTLLPSYSQMLTDFQAFFDYNFPALRCARILDDSVKNGYWVDKKIDDDGTQEFEGFTFTEDDKGYTFTKKYKTTLQENIDYACGFRSTHGATIDFPEANYVHSRYIVEFWNTLSSFLVIYYAYAGVKSIRKMPEKGARRGVEEVCANSSTTKKISTSTKNCSTAKKSGTKNFLEGDKVVIHGLENSSNFKHFNGMTGTIAKLNISKPSEPARHLVIVDGEREMQTKAIGAENLKKFKKHGISEDPDTTENPRSSSTSGSALTHYIGPDGHVHCKDCKEFERCWTDFPRNPRLEKSCADFPRKSLFEFSSDSRAPNRRAPISSINVAFLTDYMRFVYCFSILAVVGFGSVCYKMQ